LLRTLFLFAALLLSACSNTPSAVDVAGEGKPALWKVSGPKGNAWLFGTVHLLPPDTDWQSPTLDEAIRNADSLVLEASGLDDEQAVAQIFAQMGVSGGLPSLDSRVDPALRPNIARLDEAIPGPRKVLDHMESWAAALTLASVMSADLGLSAGQGVEKVLTLRFKADGKAITGLETISQQFGYFDRLSEVDQRLMLNAILRGEKTSAKDYESTLAAWMRGDADGVFDDKAGGILASPNVREALLDGRNRNWTKQIAAMISNGQRPFVAVGAGHMAGKGGVPALLTAAGYKVVRIQ
jgi:uncharacterized protein